MTSIFEMIVNAGRRTPLVNWIPGFIKQPLIDRYLTAIDKEAPEIEKRALVEGRDYRSRLAEEREIFTAQTEVNDLPPIFHYWSNKFLRPALEQFGFSNPDQFFASYLEQSFHSADGEPVRFASIGAGNCDTEVRVAKMLVERGISAFTLECLDLNEAMLERGSALAVEHGVRDQIKTTQIDFNAWHPEPRAYCAVMANQSLHHVLELEALFDVVERGLEDRGRFLASDMIGRNGHMRWPEAMRIIHEYWLEMPESYRWNLQLNRQEDLLEYWDCSKEGFEGIRAQDILPLAIEKFDCEMFLPYGNLIDPFIDRSFGPHFDPGSAIDCELIDRIHARDQSEILAGTVKPTHMFAVFRKRPFAGKCQHPPGLSPEFCVRSVS